MPTKGVHRIRVSKVIMGTYGTPREFEFEFLYWNGEESLAVGTMSDSASKRLSNSILRSQEITKMATDLSQKIEEEANRAMFGKEPTEEEQL